MFQNNLYSIIKLTYKGISKEFKSPFITKYENENLLGAILASLLLGRHLEEIVGRLKSFKRPKRRMNVRVIKGKILVWTMLIIRHSLRRYMNMLIIAILI